MKKIGVVVLMMVGLFSCNAETDAEIILEDGVDANSSLTICDCIEPVTDNAVWCAKNYPAPLTAEQKAECEGDTSSIEPTTEEKEEIRTNYENDLSLEIKEIEEEKEDPISKECKQFLEEYAAAIKDFKRLTDKIDKNPDDIGLKISYASQSEEMNSWGSKPQMFMCSQSDAFKKQVEILNVKKDKLIEN